MAVSRAWGVLFVGVLFVGILVVSALLFGVYIRGP